MPGVIAALNGSEAVKALNEAASKIVSVKQEEYEFTEEELEEARERLKKVTADMENKK